MINGLKRRAGLGGGVAAAFALVIAAPAGAYSAATGYRAGNYVTGFPESAANHWGPLGIAFDQSDNLYVADAADGNIYRFQPGGGVASADTRLTSSPIKGRLAGLIVSSSGNLYLARYQAGDVVQIDSGTGRIVRTIASVPCATGLAIDPVSGDLFVSQNQCGSTIYRISGYQSGPATVSSYSSAPGVDGLAFDKSGTLYAESDGNILEMGGTSSSTPGRVTKLAKVPSADGLAFGAHASGQPPFLVVNRNDGRVTRVGFDTQPPSKENIFIGGSRGDFAAVDSSGCLYITQSASIVRIHGQGSRCTFEASTAGSAPPPGLSLATVSGARSGRACARRRALVVRVWQRGRVRLKSLAVYLNGKRIERVKGASVTGPIVVKHPPTSAFTLKIVATTTRGKRLVTRRHYSSCHRRRRACVSTRRLAIRLPRRDGQIVLADAYIRGRLVKRERGRSLKRIVLHRLPHRRFTVKLVMRTAGGKRFTVRRTFVGCR
jgi:sugar lactone lactonase YvrE